MNLGNACMIGLVELCTDKTDKDWKQFSFFIAYTGACLLDIRA